MGLLTESLWRDEAFSALMIRHNPGDIIRLAAGDATPPLFYLLLHFWSNIFGNSEVALRALPLIFFLATAVVMYRVGEKLQSKSGWIVALLTLTQPFLFSYGFELRAYSLLALLTALTILFYLEKRVWLLTGALIALLYTHLFGVWVVGLLFLWTIIKRGNLWPYVLAGLAFLPWIPNYLAFSRLTSGWQHFPDPQTLVLALSSLGTLLLILVLPGLKEIVRKTEARLLLLLWGGPIVGTILISLWKPLFIDRYLIETVPPALALAGWALKEKTFRPLLVTILLIQVLASGYIFTHPGKPPFRDLAQTLLREEKPGDAVLNGSSLTYFESQYYGLSAPIYSPHNDVPYYVGKVLIPDKDILTSLPAAPRLWIIEIEEGGGMMKSEFPGKLLGSQEFGSLKLSLYEPK